MGEDASRAFRTGSSYVGAKKSSSHGSVEGACKCCTALAGELGSNGTLRCGVGRMGRECQAGL
jgi:hypothetical protein